MYWAIIIISIVIFLILSTIILPRFILKVGYNKLSFNDNGVKAFFKNGNKVLLFNANEASNKYISQYLLTNEKDKKTLICRYKDNISDIEFDIVCFNEKNKQLKTVFVSESFIENSTSRTIDLPYKTSYVTLVVKNANGEAIKGPRKRYIPKSINLFLVLESVLLIAAVCAIRYSLSILFGDVFYYDIIHNQDAQRGFILVSVLILCINTLFVELFFNFKKVK